MAVLFDAGAAEVHVRVSSPPVVSPCFYGIDMSTREQMIAKRGTRTIFHSNAITTWSISDKGEVKHVYA